MFSLRNLTLIALGLCFALELSAQTTPTMSQLPWWDYRPERIDNDFESIIGLSGTTLVSGSENRYYYTYSPTLFVNMPFAFNFMRTNYPSGHRVTVDHSGRVGFATYNDPGNLYYLAMLYPYPSNQTYYREMDKNLLPYWTDLQTYSVTSPAGGIYWRVDGTSPNRIMTFEWRVAGGIYPSGNVGNFQARLFEATSTIEYHYGENSIDRTVPTDNPQYTIGYGALIGIRHHGQPQITRELTPQDFNNDEELFLLFLHPDQVVRGMQPGEDTIAITRINTMNMYGSSPYTPVWYAYYESYATANYVYYRGSPYWTYSYPREDGQPIGYRLRPILNDVVCDSVWFSPQSAINAYVANSAVTVNAIFSNQASAIKNNVPVQFQVRYGSAKILIHTSEQQTVSPGSRLGTDDVTFTAIPGTKNDRNGIYEVKVYSQDPNEEDRKNDTCKVSYFILGQHDVLAYSILQPFENVPPLYTKYPVGFGVPIEARFLNVGVNAETNVPVGYEIYRAGESTPIFSGTTVIPGNFSSASYRDYLLPQWTPQQPGTYCMKVYSDLSTDEDHMNDTVPALGQYCFTAAYEIELAASPDEVSPQCFARYPVGQPIRVTGTFRNDGITDATNTPATATIIDPAGNQVYNETITIQEVVADGGQALAEFPNFVPAQTSGPGTYRLTISASNTQDPIAGNNSYTCTFRVLPQLSGDILVGFGERFQTIKEARDSLFYLGVSGHTNLILIDDEFRVAPINNDASQPALDFRGRIVGAGENAKITWRAHPSKTMVTVRLQSPSGVGIMFGQQVDNNPNGYMVFDGGEDRKLRFTLENTGTRDLYVPFYFGRGASNYTVRNVEIMPYGGGDFHCTQTVSIPTYDRTFNQFRWVGDLDQKISAGIMLRNTMPDVISGGQIRPDTLVNEGNLFENNEIHGFGYGIASVGAGPIFRTQSSRFEAVTNRTNTIRDNEIHNVSRAGILLAYESGSDIVGNRIWDVENDCGGTTTESKGVTGSATNEPHAAGIWVTSGGNATNNRAFSNNLEIERNMVSEISTTNGNAAGIWVETGREILITPSNVVQSLPTGGSNIEVQNNMAWSYEGSAMSAGIAFSLPGGNTGVNADYRPMGDQVQNNTIYNPASWGTDNFGIVADLGATTVQNNIVAVLNQNAIALVYRTRTPQYEPMNISQVSDYNLIWVPNGSVGMLQRYSPEGYALPSPPVAKTLQQWQYLTGLDMNSVSGNIVPEFISTTPGAEDLHLNAQQTNTLAGNRGMTIAGLINDVDEDPRGQAAINGRYDIGADEFWGVVRNNDLVAENVIGPNGYRATTGRFSDAEYVMSDSLVAVTSRIRNVGGLPRTNVLVTTQVSYWSGSSWVPVTTLSKTANIDAGEASDVAMGTFMPSTLAELGMSDAQFGTMSTNVTPIYRFTVIMGDDDNFANNRFEKQVRFYVQRSTTESMVTVEHYRPGVAANAIVGQVNLGNKLNADSIMAGLTAIRWDRSGTVGGSNSGFSYDVFERDNWPQHALNFAPWGMLMWMQGDEAEGLLPEERWAIKAQQEAYDEWRRAGLFITGQEVARIHDVTLDAGNGTRADREFVEHYLRADYRGNTNPALYDNRRVQGIRITPGRFEVVASTGVAGDLGPYPSVLRATGGEGIAQGTHWYVEHTGADSLAGMTAAELDRATVYYATDIRHWGRFAPDADRSGVQRVVLGAIDFLNQYGTVLPVELLSFEATQTGRETVSLSWETGAEIDVAKMVIERAEVIGGVAGEEFTGVTRIGERIAEGSATSGSTYDLVDATVRGGATYEYRLVSVELDGTEEIVSRRRVEIRGGAGSALDLVVLPNVVTETGTISWRVPRGVEGVVEIIDNRGVVVQSQVVSGNGSGDLSITAGDLPSGNYVVVLRAGEEVLESRMQIRK